MAARSTARSSPSPATRDTSVMAIDNGIKLIVVVAGERIPRGDVAEMVEFANDSMTPGSSVRNYLRPDSRPEVMGGIGGPAMTPPGHTAPVSSA